MDTLSKKERYSVRMEMALDADGCRTVRKFFSTLLHSRQQYGKFDIAKLMKAYVKEKTGVHQYQDRPVKWTVDKRQEIHAMLDNGMTLKQIGTHYNVTAMNILQVLNHWEGFSVKEYRRGAI